MIVGEGREAMGLRRVFDDLVRFETALWNTVDVRLKQECGVPLGNLNAMMIIAATPGCRVQDIAAALEITVGGTSQAVDRLEKLGHCVRRPNPADRRSSVIELTAAGQEVLERAGTVFDRELEKFLRVPLSVAALDSLGAALATLRAAASGEPIRALSAGAQRSSDDQ
ncbi:MarR family winged helix-turn-helix transcriptional regulator [Amycolatopsis sp. lyj-109]|uniref:MarR family winged helix-turn-helix transcriptional regulator n=1 Tax=Amycolatopsis sp. lyj-109 TaxID=2789287 RepID=UPI003979C0D4